MLPSAFAGLKHTNGFGHGKGRGREGEHRPCLSLPPPPPRHPSLSAPPSITHPLQLSYRISLSPRWLLTLPPHPLLTRAHSHIHKHTHTLRDMVEVENKSGDSRLSQP